MTLRSAVRRWKTGHGHRPRCQPRPTTRPVLQPLEDRTVPSATAAYGQLPLAFEANQGQADPAVAFLAHGSGYSLALTPQQAVLTLQQPPGPDGITPPRTLCTWAWSAPTRARPPPAPTS